MTKLLLLTAFLFACGSAPAPTAPKPAPVSVVSAGELKIAMTFETEKGSGTGEIVVAADGTFAATITSASKGSKTKTGKLTPDELFDDTGKLFAKIGPDSTVSVLHETEHRENGKLVKLDATWMDVGTIDADGTFTSKRDGSKISVGADGTIVGLSFPGMTYTVTAGGPAQKRTAVFFVIAMLVGGKSIMNSSGAVSVPAAPETTY